ncbi:MAG: hypothetical protein IKP72_06950 [Clostridia bacterium]|nr:hypothetical protein [Clostridia bacterium]
MAVKVVHLESGVTEVKNNVELVLEFEDRFEPAGKRKKTRGKPVRAYLGSLFMFEALVARKKACGGESKDCQSCDASISADNEKGKKHLVCSAHFHDRVPEDGYYDDYN